MRINPIKFSLRQVKRSVAQCFSILLFAAFFSVNTFAESLNKIIETDLDFDGKTERIDLDSKREPALQIWRDGKLLWQGVHNRWKPWKLEIADVDGDGRREIVVGVFKATKFFPKPHNCLFVYGFSGEKASPKWLGSTLSRPFTDFMFADLDGVGGEELIALETTLEGKKSLALYRWNSFGFTLDWRRGTWQTAKILAAEKGRILVEADGKQIFVWKDETR